MRAKEPMDGGLYDSEDEVTRNSRNVGNRLLIDTA